MEMWLIVFALQKEAPVWLPHYMTKVNSGMEGCRKLGQRAVAPSFNKAKFECVFIQAEETSSVQVVPPAAPIERPAPIGRPAITPSITVKPQ